MHAMTEELFRTDAYARTCEATVTAADATGIALDRTVFYAAGGGQPGDTGVLRLGDGTIRIIDTRKGPTGGIVHVPAPDQALPSVGAKIVAEIDWDRRYRHMRMHTCLHLLCAAVPAGVTGGSIGDGKGRLDFDAGDTVLDKAEIEAKVNDLIAQTCRSRRAGSTTARWRRGRNWCAPCRSSRRAARAACA